MHWRIPNRARWIILKKLAERDGSMLVDGIVHIRCATCRVQMVLTDATIGHRIPRCNGGTNNLENLQLDCEPCNQKDSEKWGRKRTAAPGRPEPEVPYAELCRRVRKKYPQLFGKNGRLFDNVSVLDRNGKCLSYTSAIRALALVEAAAAKIVEIEDGLRPRIIQLSYTIPNAELSNEPIPNVCRGCGAAEGLGNFKIIPAWHPARTRMPIGVGTAVLCDPCRNLVAAEYQRAIDALCAYIPTPWPERRRLLKKRSALLRYYMRRTKGLSLAPEDVQVATDLTGEAEPDLRRVSKGIEEMKEDAHWAVWVYCEARRRRAVDAGLEFSKLFEECMRKLMDATQKSGRCS